MQVWLKKLVPEDQKYSWSDFNLFVFSFVWQMIKKQKNKTNVEIFYVEAISMPTLLTRISTDSVSFDLATTKKHSNVFATIHNVFQFSLLQKWRTSPVT